MRVDARQARNVMVLRSIALEIDADQLDREELMRVLYGVGNVEMEVELPDGRVAKHCLVKDAVVQIGSPNMLYLEIEEQPE